MPPKNHGGHAPNALDAEIAARAAAITAAKLRLRVPALTAAQLDDALPPTDDERTRRVAARQADSRRVRGPYAPRRRI